MAARVLLEKWLSGPPPKPTGIASVASEDCRQSHCEAGVHVFTTLPFTISTVLIASLFFG